MVEEELVTDAVDLVRGHARRDDRGGGLHRLGRDATGDPHELDRLGVLDLGREVLVRSGLVDVLGTLDRRWDGAPAGRPHRERHFRTSSAYGGV